MHNIRYDCLEVEEKEKYGKFIFKIQKLCQNKN